MIFNLSGGGNPNLEVKFHGGYGDKVTFNGISSSNSFELDFTGKTSITGKIVKAGSYKVTSTYLSNVGIDSITVKIDRDNIDVPCFPSGAIFWFGNGDSEGDKLWDKCGGWTAISGAYPDDQGRTGAAWEKYAYGIAVDNDGWKTVANQAGSSSQYGATSRITNQITYTGYSKIKSYCESAIENNGLSGIGICENGFTGAGAWTAQSYLNLGASAYSTKVLNLNGSSGYFCAAAFGADYVRPFPGAGYFIASSANNTVKAVWLE